MTLERRDAREADEEGARSVVFILCSVVVRENV
jgi:hypothetical protein